MERSTRSRRSCTHGEPVLYGWKPIIRAADPEGNDNCGRRIILSTTRPTSRAAPRCAARTRALPVRNSAGLYNEDITEPTAETSLRSGMPGLLLAYDKEETAIRRPASVPLPPRQASLDRLLSLRYLRFRRRFSSVVVPCCMGDMM